MMVADDDNNVGDGGWRGGARRDAHGKEGTSEVELTMAGCAVELVTVRRRRSG